MRTLQSIAVIAGLAAAAVGSTGVARPYEHHDDRQILHLENRLDRVAYETRRGMRADMLNPREMAWLESRINQAAHRFEMFGKNGFSRSERRELANRISTLERGLRVHLRSPNYASNDWRR